MDFSGYDDTNKKKTLLMMLIKMAKADMEHHTHENQFLYEIANKFGIDTADVVHMLAGLEIPEKDLPRTEEERMRFFFYVLSMMQMDNIVTIHEREVAREIGHVLALNPMLIVELTDAFEAQLNPSSPDEDLNAIILKYLN